MLSWVFFFLTGPGALLTAYLLLQIIALLKLRSWWRWLSLLPLPIVVYGVKATLDGYQADSNLWPLPMMAVSAGAGVALLLLFLTRYLVLRRTS